jgi:hypothetical protein
MVFCKENAMYFFPVYFSAHWTLAIVIPTCSDDNNIVLNMIYINSLSDLLTWQQFRGVISYKSVPLKDIITSYFT